MTDDTTIYPNAMPFVETKDLLNKGVLEMVVDQGLALVAIRSGVRLTNAGKAGLIMMLVGPAVAVILAFTEAWWWLIVSAFALVGGFRFVRRQAVEAVGNAALRHEALFLSFRERGLIRFQFRD